MNKYEFVTELMELFDAIDALKRDNEDLRHALKSHPDTSTNDAAEVDDCRIDGGYFDMFDYFALKKGRAEILDDCTYSWNRCEAWRNSAGDIEVTDFDKWVTEKISSVPDYMSRMDFDHYFAAELKELYSKEKAKAILRLDASEAEEGGE